MLKNHEYPYMVTYYVFFAKLLWQLIALKLKNDVNQTRTAYVELVIV